MADTKTSVIIKYSKPGAAPPIYLAGSFPDSVWQPQEMEYTNDSEDHYVFSKAVEVEEGKEYQYKFRIGDGDWWMSDEDAPIGMSSPDPLSLFALKITTASLHVVWLSLGIKNCNPLICVQLQAGTKVDASD